MARIPTVTSQVAARSGRTSQGVPTPQASPEAFGAGAGRGLQAIGAGLQDAARGLYVYNQERREEEVANAVAQSDFTRTELELRNQVGPDASGYQNLALNTYDQWVDEQAEQIEDDQARQMFRDRMAAQRAGVSSRAAQYELGTAAENSLNQANASLTALDNRVRLDPASYDNVLEQGFAVIDARGDIPAHTRSQMRTSWTQAAALSRFEGMLERATTVEEVRAVQSELNGEEGSDWASQLSQAGMERILTLADGASRAIQTQADAEARAAVDYLEGRAGDVTSVIPREELMAAQDVVARSGNPVTLARMARIARDQDLIAGARRLTPEQQRDRIDARYSNPSLPPRVNTAITNAAQMFGVSPAYLAMTAQREYGMYLTGDPESVNYGHGNAEGASSARGIMQFIDGTWLQVVTDPQFQAVTGLNLSGMSEQEILDLRRDPELSMMAGAFFTANNARLARAALGREPTDADLYIMHFMGEGGGPRLFRTVRANPDVVAADMFPAQARANRSVYYDGDRPRTVREVYLELGRMHGSDPGQETYMEYGDRQTLERVLQDTENRLANDPMSFAFSVGTASIGDVFAPGGMAERGSQARAVADYYNIPLDQMKPFTESEASALGERFANGSSDDVLEILTAIQQMEGPVARAAMNQLDDVHDVYAYAGGLQLETGQGAVAADIVRGQRRLEENPDIQRQIGATEQDISDAFLNATGGALMDAAPDQRQAIMDAALAHYVETSVARGRAGRFDNDMFAASVQAVLGGRQGAPALDEVNGARTVLPPGVSGADIETAFNNMTVADWTSMSEHGLPPRYVTGALAEPDDIADEATLRAIGGGRYRVALSDGSYLVTGRPGQNGRLEAFIFVPTAERIREINTKSAERAVRDDVGDPEVVSGLLGQGERPAVSQQVTDVQAAMEDGNLTFEEQQLLFSRYGQMWAYDDQGNRIAPTQ